MTIRIAFIFLLIFTCAALSQAQQEQACTLKLAQLGQAAELKRLRPGMTIEQVKSVVPKIEMGPTDEFGLSKTSFSPDFNPNIDKQAFQGVRTVSLDFLDGRVSSLWIGYNESFKWKTLDEFVKGITAALSLPARWETRSRGQQLTCGDFQVMVSMVAGSPTLRITDDTARELWEKRRAEKEEAEP